MCGVGGGGGGGGVARNGVKITIDFITSGKFCFNIFLADGYSVNSVLYKWNKEKVSTSNSLIRELAQFVLVRSSSSTRNIIYYSGEFANTEI